MSLAVAFAVLVGAGPASADAEDAEHMARQVLIALRVLAYDRALPVRVTTSDVVVMIVHAPAKASRDDRDRWLAGFALLPNVKTGGKRVRAIAVEYSAEKAFDDAVAKHLPALLVVAPGLDKELAPVKRVARRHHALSFSAREADVRRGVAFGVVDGGDDKRVIVNLEAARAEGAKFAAGLLQLARIVEDEP